MVTSMNPKLKLVYTKSNRMFLKPPMTSSLWLFPNMRRESPAPCPGGSPQMFSFRITHVNCTPKYSRFFVPLPDHQPPDAKLQTSIASFEKLSAAWHEWENSENWVHRRTYYLTQRAVTFFFRRGQPITMKRCRCWRSENGFTEAHKNQRIAHQCFFNEDDLEENADFENAKKGSLDHKKIFNALCITKLFLFGAVLKKMCFLCFRNVNVNR